MLNVKYTLQTDDQGGLSAGINPNAFGNAWFVDAVRVCRSADEEIRRLANEDLTKIALTTDEIPQNTFYTDSLSQITLTHHKANALTYQS
jgi:hypothetical protein